MDQESLVKEQIETGRQLVKEFNDYMPVAASFWARDNEYGRWWLYIASDKINDATFDLAYGEIARLTTKIPDDWFDPFRVKVAGVDNSLVRAVMDFQSRSSGATRFRGATLGGANVSEAYVYPLPNLVSGTPSHE